MNNKKLSLKIEIWALIWFYVTHKAFSIIIFFIFLFLNQDTSDSSLIQGIALIPSGFIYYKVRKYYKEKDNNKK